MASLLVEELAALRTPTLILQGERDSFGRREEVETYTLSPAVQLGWMPSGDHSFKPTRSSGLSEAETWGTAVVRADQFLRGCWGVREALENPSHPRKNTPVIAGADWVHGQQAARIR